MPPEKRNRAFPTGNALLYISLSYADLIASFSSSAILNNVFAICNSRLLPTNQIVNCDGRVRPIQGRTLFFYGNSCCPIRNEWVISANAQCSGLIQNPPRKSCTDLKVLRPIGAFPSAQQCIL